MEKETIFFNLNSIFLFAFRWHGSLCNKSKKNASKVTNIKYIVPVIHHVKSTLIDQFRDQKSVISAKERSCGLLKEIVIRHPNIGNL